MIIVTTDTINGKELEMLGLVKGSITDEKKRALPVCGRWLTDPKARFL
ncbi:MAG: hypothetical protein IJX90_00885 [Blautia sp.]|nr:hypothetical protein [Blautia sp.]